METQRLPLSQVHIKNVKVESGILVSGHEWDIGGVGAGKGELERRLGWGEAGGDGRFPG